MKISVIIPVYNTAYYLEQCLDSVIAQNFEDWECLLINDGSTDLSGMICDYYAESDTRFRVFHTPNSGVSAARNLGIEYAKGDYIAFIDSDDTVESDYLSDLYKDIVTHKADLAICGMKRIYPEETKSIYVKAGTLSPGNDHSDQFIELNRKHLLYGPVIKLYRSDIIQSKEIRFPLGVHFGEDLIFNFDYLEHVGTLVVSEATNYNYRILPSGTLSKSDHSRDFRNNYEQWKIIRAFFQRKGINTSNARVFLSDRLWGLAYDTVMSRKLPLKEIRKVFSRQFIKELLDFDTYSIRIPNWIKVSISRRIYVLIWLLQRRMNYI